MYDKLLGEIKKSVAEQYGDGYEVHLYEIITPGGCSIPSIAVRTPLGKHMPGNPHRPPVMPHGMRAPGT